MRTRDEILKELEELRKTKTPITNDSEVINHIALGTSRATHYQKIIVELLLDDRDLLVEIRDLLKKE